MPFFSPSYSSVSSYKNLSRKGDTLKFSQVPFCNNTISFYMGYEKKLFLCYSLPPQMASPNCETYKSKEGSVQIELTDSQNSLGLRASMDSGDHLDSSTASRTLRWEFNLPVLKSTIDWCLSRRN